MGGAGKATGRSGEAQETKNVGGRFESHTGSHHEALGGLPQSPEIFGVGPLPPHSRRSNALDQVMPPTTTCIVRAAAIAFCLVVVVLANAPLLAGTAARATCGDCPVLSVNPRASRPLGRATARRPCRVQTSNGLPLPDPKCTPGAINPTVTLAVLRDKSFRTGCVRNCSTTPKGRSATYRRYGIQHPKGNSGRNQTCELDHLVPLEMGGADTIEKHLAAVRSSWRHTAPALFQAEGRGRELLDRASQRRKHGSG